MNATIWPMPLCQIKVHVLMGLTQVYATGEAFGICGYLRGSALVEYVLVLILSEESFTQRAMRGDVLYGRER